MKKEQVDLENRTVPIYDSKTPNGVADVPLAEIALKASESQMAVSERESQRSSKIIEDRLAVHVCGEQASDTSAFTI